MKRKLGLLVVSVAVGVLVSAGVAAAAASPSVETAAATQIKETSAVLNGKVTPNGASTTYWFVWGLTPAYGNTSAKHSAGSGGASVSIRVTAGKLLPGTKYYYRLYAQNKYGLSAGAGHDFTTSGHPLPGAITGAATAVTGSAATVTGTIVPNNQTTRWQFQYGLAAGVYTSSTPGGTVAAGSKPVGVAEQISGLEAGTTFHYRLVAVHSGFPSSDGLDQTFTTFPSARPYPRMRASTKPHFDGAKPFVFTTTGTIFPSASFPSTVQCNGVVAIRYFAGRREVGLRFANVQPNCTFSEQVVFTHTFAPKPGKRRPQIQRLRIVVRFRGNGYLAPRTARREHVVLG